MDLLRSAMKLVTMKVWEHRQAKPAPVVSRFKECSSPIPRAELRSYPLPRAIGIQVKDDDRARCAEPALSWNARELQRITAAARQEIGITYILAFHHDDVCDRIIT